MIEVRNIKISVVIESISLNNAIDKLVQSNIYYKQFSNFISFKYNYTFVIFKTGSNNQNHINISRIKCKQDIKKAVKIIKKLFHIHIISIKIDNIVSTSNLNKPINLHEIVKNQLIDCIKYNPEQFPGLFAKFKEGTVIIFHSGKIVIVGCKSYKHLLWVVKETHARLRTL